jgi:hypothetical protein
MTPDTAVDALSSIEATVQRLNDLSVRNNGINSLIMGSFFGLCGMLPSSELGSVYIIQTDILHISTFAVVFLTLAMGWSFTGRSAGNPPPTSNKKNLWPHLFSFFLGWCLVFFMPKIGVIEVGRLFTHWTWTELGKYGGPWPYLIGVGSACAYFIWLGRQWAVAGIIMLLTILMVVWMAPDNRLATLWLGIPAAFHFAVGVYLAKSTRVA